MLYNLPFDSDCVIPLSALHTNSVQTKFKVSFSSSEHLIEKHTWQSTRINGHFKVHGNKPRFLLF